MAAGEEAAPWPSAAEEAVYLAEEGGRPEAPAGPPAAPADAGPPLPPLESLIGRVPAEVRAALDEHFRAKITAVRRIPATVKLEP